MRRAPVPQRRAPPAHAPRAGQHPFTGGGRAGVAGRRGRTGTALYLQPARGEIRLPGRAGAEGRRSEEHTSELQSLMRISYAVFCLKKKNNKQKKNNKKE